VNLFHCIQYGHPSSIQFQTTAPEIDWNSVQIGNEKELARVYDIFCYDSSAKAYRGTTLSFGGNN
jgi:hypothetical protein